MNRCQVSGVSFQRIRERVCIFLKAESWQLNAGFTLVETLLAVSLLSIAITAPMVLTMQALTSAYYARDQITASHLAQEGLEAVHAIRDKQILTIATTDQGESESIDLFGALEDYAVSDDPFKIDATEDEDGAISDCEDDCDGDSEEDALRTDGRLYGYDEDWTPTNFIRKMTVCYVQDDGTCGTGETDEIQVTVTMYWHTSSYQQRTFEIKENLYRWVRGGDAL